MSDNPGSGLGVILARMDAMTERFTETRDLLRETSKDLNRVKEQLQQVTFELQATKNELAQTKVELTTAKTEIEALKTMLSRYRGGVAAILGLGGLAGYCLSTLTGLSKFWGH